MDIYSTTGRPDMRELLLEHQPLFLIANSPSLEVFSSDEVMYTGRRLKQEDQKVLNSNFIHHWGKLYVAGKRFDFTCGALLQKFEILISGHYQLESDIAISIDGKSLNPGDIIELTRDYHTIIAPAGVDGATLRWSRDLYRPSFKPSEQSIFLDF